MTGLGLASFLFLVVLILSVVNDDEPPAKRRNDALNGLSDLDETPFHSGAMQHD